MSLAVACRESVEMAVSGLRLPAASFQANPPERRVMGGVQEGTRSSAMYTLVYADSKIRSEENMYRGVYPEGGTPQGRARYYSCARVAAVSTREPLPHASRR